MSIDAALRSILLTAPAIADGRVHAVMRPAGGALPAVVYERESGYRVQSADGQSGLAAPRYAFTVWARTIDEAKTTAELIRLRLSDVRQRLVGAVEIDAIKLDDDGESDLVEAQPQNEPNRIFGVTMGFTVWHREAVPTHA